MLIMCLQDLVLSAYNILSNLVLTSTVKIPSLKKKSFNVISYLNDIYFGHFLLNSAMFFFLIFLVSF